MKISDLFRLFPTSLMSDNTLYINYLVGVIRVILNTEKYLKFIQMTQEKTKNQWVEDAALRARPLYTFTMGEFLDQIQSRFNNEPQQPIEIKEKAPIRGIHGLAKFLGVSPVTAQALKNSGKIPYSQYGRVVLFDGDKVLSAMEPNKKRR